MMATEESYCKEEGMSVDRSNYGKTCFFIKTFREIYYSETDKMYNSGF